MSGPELFELEWLGGPTEHHYRKLRPDIETLPWGTLKLDDLPPALVEGARRTWSEVCLNEYRALVSFTHVLRALTLVRAPLDLLGMVSNFLVDEVSHVEIACRVTMELGGAVPQFLDPTTFGVAPEGSISPLERANELVLRTSMIHENFSAGTALGNLRVSTHPLFVAVHERILADESLHRRLGHLYFTWACDRLDANERRRLARLAMNEIRLLDRYIHHPVSEVQDGITASGYRVEDIRRLGWMESALFVPTARKVVREDIAQPLATWGIEIPRDELDAFLDGPVEVTPTRSAR